jgi:nucleoside-triphosphatase THEP1
MNSKTTDQHPVKNILRFWRDTEVFNLPDFVIGKRNSEEYSPVDFNQPLPWLQGYKSSKKDHTLQYIIVIGNIAKTDVFTAISKQYDPTNTDITEEQLQAIKGNTFLFCVILSEEGKVTENYLLPSYLVGLQLLQENKSLEDVDQQIQDEAKLFEERNNIPQLLSVADELEPDTTILTLRTGDTFTANKLQQEITYLKNLTASWNPQQELNVYYKVVESKKETEVPFLNSFYLEDLNHLIHTPLKELNKSIHSLLADTVDERKRINILEDRAALLATISPTNMNTGRWPNPLSYNLYHAQLGAVQETIKTLEKDGVFSVNGPPGTGKTTLLKDVIANIIIARAQKIIEIGIDRMFTGSAQRVDLDDGSFTYYYHELNKAFLGEYGIVVTSNNNSAVENISRDLPNIKSVAIDDFEDLNYFKDFSIRLHEEAQENWGILAAVLGNKANRAAFISRFWYDGYNNAGNRIPGFFTLLKNIVRQENAQKQPDHKNAYNDTIIRFKEYKLSLDQFKKQTTEYHQLLTQYPAQQAQLSVLSEKEHQLRMEIDGYRQTREQLFSTQQQKQQQLSQYQNNLTLLKETRPSFYCIHQLLRTKAYSAFKSLFTIQVKQLLSLQNELQELDEKIQATHLAITQHETAQTKIRARKNILEQDCKRFTALKNTLQTTYDIDNKNIPDKTFYTADIKTLHLGMPYFSAKIAAIQSKLFLEALKIHELSIKINEAYFSKNLNYFFGVLLGKPVKNTSVLQHLWDTFFICVPVISTTLASVSRQFSPDLKIGWTLIDEAGQAVPQSAMGIINRSLRTVIIGDPLQIEPVVTIPNSLVEKLRTQYDVPVRWSPYKCSLQQLGDRINLQGSIITHNDESTWTGFPLRVHRRCIEPMFSISNNIAYNGQMVLPEEMKKAVSRNNVFFPTNWLHIEGKNIVNKHVVTEEVEALEKILQQMIVHPDGQSEDIYVISPFKSVADYCRYRFNEVKYPNVKCGTIHTFQGKEANTVFLILGTSAGNSGARSWASAKPNLLNVAVTRARKNFIVIGNKDLWRNRNYFNELFSKTYHKT